MRDASKLMLAMALACASGCQSPADRVATAPGDAAPSAAHPTGAEDTCGAASQASLLGQDHRQLPPAPAGKVVRVLCTTCPMTMDFNAQRLNVFYDQGTGKVTRLSCG